MKYSFKTIMSSIFFYLCAALGISLTVKANIGISSVNAINASLAGWLDIQIGTCVILFNVVFIAFYVVLSRCQYPVKYMMQVIAILVFGSVINFFVYRVFAFLEITNYPARLLIFIVGTLVGGIGTGMVLNLGFISFAIEACCHELAQQSDRPFALYRYGVDFLAISGSIAITLLFDQLLYIREGTLISFFLLSLIISWVREKWRVHDPIPVANPQL